MNEESITGDMLVAEVLEGVSEALALFQAHGVNPITDCGPNRYIYRLDETPARCKIEDLEELIADLNAAVAAEL